MKTKLKFTLLVCGGLLAVVLLAFALLPDSHPSANPSQGRDQENHGTKSALVKRTGTPTPDRTFTSHDRALPAALAETDPARHRKLLEQWADSVDVKAMPDTLEQTSSITDGDLNVEALAALLSSWSTRDLAGAVTWFGERGGADRLHQQARDSLARAMSDSAPAEMLDWMAKSLPESGRKELYIPLCQQWMSRDPEGTAALLGRMISPSAANPDAANPAWIDLAGQVAAQWANTDVNRAVSWAQSLPEGPAKVLALSQVSYKWTETNPRTAAAYAAQEDNPQLLGNVAGKWAESDPQAAAGWVSGLPGGEGQNRAIASMTAIWAGKDPVAAATYTASHLEGDVQEKATIAVVSAWAYTDPLRAAQWAGKFPEGSMRDQAMEQLVNTWAGSDTAEAALWLQSLPQSRSRDVAVNTFSSAVGPSSPGTAFQLAQTISDEGMRTQQLQNVGRAWLAKDPSGAQQAIAQSNLPQGIKSQLLSTAAQ